MSFAKEYRHSPADLDVDRVEPAEPGLDQPVAKSRCVELDLGANRSMAGGDDESTPSVAQHFRAFGEGGSDGANPDLSDLLDSKRLPTGCDRATLVEDLLDAALELVRLRFRPSPVVLESAAPDPKVLPLALQSCVTSGITMWRYASSSPGIVKDPAVFRSTNAIRTLGVPTAFRRSRR